VAVVLLVAALAVSLLASVQLLVVLGVYAAVQLSYGFWLKHQPVLDIVIVAWGGPPGGDRGWGGHRHPVVTVVLAGGGLRVVVHGGEQASTSCRRTSASRST
jgi:hypothetical protein